MIKGSEKPDESWKKYEFGYFYHILEPGDIIEFEGVQGRHRVMKVVHRKGRMSRIMGGGDTPDEWTVTFADNTWVVYNPWVNREKTYRRFRVVDKFLLPPPPKRNKGAYISEK